jgi:hypothetical protein
MNAYPVKVCFRVLGEIKVDNNVDSLDVYSPRKKICKWGNRILLETITTTTTKPFIPKQVGVGIFRNDSVQKMKITAVMLWCVIES